MPAYALNLLAGDFSYGILPAWLCLAVAIYFLLRRPVANAFLSLPLVGIGGAPVIVGYTYARISAMIAVLTVFALFAHRRQTTGMPLVRLGRTKLMWVGWVCLAILLKILIETAVYGLNASRSVSLSVGMVSVLYPVTVLLLGIGRSGPEAVSRDLLFGMVAFPAIMTVGYLPFALTEGQISESIQGATRFTFGASDTINTARVLAHGAIGSLLFVSLSRRLGTWFNVLAIAGGMGFVGLILLSGNRQYLLGVAAFLFLWVWFLKARDSVHWVLGVIVVVCLATVTYDAVTSSELVVRSRISSGQLSTEMSEGRGAIWAEAFRVALDHPFLGAGFKKFGRMLIQLDSAGQPVAVRDSAHGAPEDVFAEHGVFLGFAFLLGCIYLIGRSWEMVFRSKGPYVLKAAVLSLLGLSVPLPFSSVFLNATPIFLLLILVMAQECQTTLTAGRTRRVGLAAVGVVARGDMSQELGRVRGSRRLASRSGGTAVGL